MSRRPVAPKKPLAPGKPEERPIANAAPEPEFSRLFDPETIGRKPSQRRLTASPEECEALAQRFGLESLDSLDAVLSIARVAGGFHVRGEIHASLQQRCVVTLALLQRKIQADFEEVYERHTGPATDLEIEGTADVAELDRNGKIDLGEMIAQELAGEIDPYPHAPGVAFEWTDPAVSDSAERPEAAAEGPFAALSKLKDPN